MPRQQPPLDLIPSEAEIRSRRSTGFGNQNPDLCCCGVWSNYPYKDDCKDTGLDELLGYIERSSKPEPDLQPPKKRRRTAGTENPSPIEAEPPHCIVVFRESINLDFFHFESSLYEIKQYTTSGIDTITHIARTEDGHTMRLIVSEYSGNEYKNDLIDVILPKSSANLELIAVASRISHMQRGMRGTGRFWVETTFKAVPTKQSHKLMVRWELKWSTTSTLEVNAHSSNNDGMVVDWVIKRLLPAHVLDSDITPQGFYESINVPPMDDGVASQMKIEGIVPTLYPYQRRSVRWMLNREGVDWSATTKSLAPCLKRKSVDILHKSMDVDGQLCWISPIFDLVTTSRHSFATKDISGGLLLEEMGLGKTIEIISLILMHRRQFGHDADTKVHDDFTSRDVTPIKATLIICPPAILKQWEEEFERHAPELAVFVYNNETARKSLDQTELLTRLRQQDVVLTTYPVIGREIYHLDPPPPRGLRSSTRARVCGAPKKKEPVLSPLVQFSWWRTILDEVQMIDGGATKAAHVAKKIPRINAWGVTGTPVKSDMIGVHSLLDFLRYEPFVSDKSAWKALLTRDKKTFQEICQRIAIRHTKQMVREEMRLPAQKRYVLRMPFAPIEEQHYQNIFADMCGTCGINAKTGLPVNPDWNQNDHEAKLRQFLLRLRINTLYPDLSSSKGLRQRQQNLEPETAGELLHAMLMDNLSLLHSSERELLSMRIARGKFHASATDSPEDTRTALDVWLDVMAEADTAVEAARDWLWPAQRDHELELGSRTINVTDEEAGIIRAADADRLAKIGVLRAHLDNMLRIQHTAVFLCANGFFSLKEVVPEEERAQYQRQEEEHYERAKAIRQEILRPIYSKCAKLMEKLKRKLDKGVEQGGFKQIPSAFQPGLAQLRLSRVGKDAGPMLEKLGEGFLEHQSVLIHEWRKATVELLCRPLIDDAGQDVTGEEYTDSTKDQEHVVLYVQAFRALIEDRNDILTGGTNQLTLAEMRDTLHKAREGDGPAPNLALKLGRERKHILGLADSKTFQDVQAELRREMAELRAAGNTDENVRALELLDAQSTRVRAFVAKQADIILALRAECAEFTKLMNLRVEYYRQLQQISDLVLDWNPDKDHLSVRVHIGVHIEGNDRVVPLRLMAAKERFLKERIAETSTRRKYLEHLEDPATQNNGLPDCIICTDKYEDGTMTVCGHFFCRECLEHWFRSHHTCPMCKRRLTYPDIHYVTHKPKELKVQEEEGMLSGLERNKVAKGIFSELSKKNLDEIMNTALPGAPMTTKADTLCRHIIWLRRQNPTTKVLVFSQFTGFLTYLKRAFAKTFDGRQGHRAIRWASIGDKNGIEKFKTDPQCCIFLLDAKSQSSGLNLVEASHVFLCEPLINTAIELQAISRVDRIGQKKETTVWLYVVDGTVEENIYDISVRRRLEHLPDKVREVDDEGVEDGVDEVGGGVVNGGKASTPDIENSLAAINSSTLAEVGSIQKLLNPKDKGGGEMVRQADLMEALFSNVRKKAGREMGGEEEWGGYGEVGEEVEVDSDS